MRISWDSAKDRLNQHDHRVPFQEAATVFSDPLIATQYDPDHSFYEHRMLALGQSERGRLIVVSYTEYDDDVRLISARRATRRERRDYESGTYA